MSRLDTTVSLHPNEIEQLQKAAKKLNVKVNEIVVRIFAAMLTKNEEIGLPEGTVSYQAPTGEYARVHVYLTPEEYEQKVDMRRLYKMSASKVLALGIELFLEDLVESWFKIEQKKTIIHVPLSQKHAIIPTYNQKYSEYRIIWGYPPH
jgi:hypothetical protein